jgi:hypothetical protein
LCFIFLAVKELNPDAAILYQGPDRMLTNVHLPSGIADDDYFICVIVAVADAYLAQTCSAAKVQVGLSIYGKDLQLLWCETWSCAIEFLRSKALINREINV